MIKPTIIMMTVMVIAIAMMSMKISTRMHLVPKCAKVSYSDKLSVGNAHRHYPK